MPQHADEISSRSSSSQVCQFCSRKVHDGPNAIAVGGTAGKPMAEAFRRVGTTRQHCDECDAVYCLECGMTTGQRPGCKAISVCPACEGDIQELRKNRERTKEQHCGETLRRVLNLWQTGRREALLVTAFALAIIAYLGMSVYAMINPDAVRLRRPSEPLGVNEIVEGSERDADAGKSHEPAKGHESSRGQSGEDAGDNKQVRMGNLFIVSTALTAIFAAVLVGSLVHAWRKGLGVRRMPADEASRAPANTSRLMYVSGVIFMMITSMMIGLGEMFSVASSRRTDVVLPDDIPEDFLEGKIELPQSPFDPPPSKVFWLPQSGAVVQFPRITSINGKYFFSHSWVEIDGEKTELHEKKYHSGKGGMRRLWGQVGSNKSVHPQLHLTPEDFPEISSKTGQRIPVTCDAGLRYTQKTLGGDTSRQAEHRRFVELYVLSEEQAETYTAWKRQRRSEHGGRTVKNLWNGFWFLVFLCGLGLAGTGIVLIRRESTTAASATESAVAVESSATQPLSQSEREFLLSGVTLMSQCGDCGQDYLLSRELRGKRIRCKACKTPFRGEIEEERIL